MTQYRFGSMSRARALIAALALAGGLATVTVAEAAPAFAQPVEVASEALVTPVQHWGDQHHHHHRPRHHHHHNRHQGGWGHHGGHGDYGHGRHHGGHRLHGWGHQRPHHHHRGHGRYEY